MIQKQSEISGSLIAETHHRTCQKWLSSLYFTLDELNFIDKLLHSNVFKPGTPNLFERLQDYLERLEKARIQLASLDGLIHDHERDLGSILESDIPPKDLEYDKKHLLLEQKVQETLGKFGMLKSEIFNYVGGILEKRKP